MTQLCEYVGFIFGLCQFIGLVFIHAMVCFHSEIYKALRTTKSGNIVGYGSLGMLCTFVLVSLLHYTGLYTGGVTIVKMLINGVWMFGITTQTTLYLDLTFIEAFGQVIIMLILVMLASIYYTAAFSRIDTFRLICYCFILFISGFIFLCTMNLIIMFCAYEAILVPTSYVIHHYSKTTRVREAVVFMVVWTQIGALVLFITVGFISQAIDFFGPGYYSITHTDFSRSIMTLAIFFGFGTKMPIWPFSWWLPEAHVEVGTGFSIVLSGVSIKLAFLGFLRFITQIGSSSVLFICLWVVVIGLIYTVLQVDLETDIKKIVAYQTVAEMHSVTSFLLLDPDVFCDYAAYMLTGHCWVSTLGFILVDMIMKRYHTRNIEHLYGVFAESPRLVKCILYSVFIGNGVPGSTLHTMELILAFASVESPYGLIIFVFVQGFLGVWSKNVWWSLLGGDVLHHGLLEPFSFTRNEFYFICILLFQLCPTLITVDALV